MVGLDPESISRKSTVCSCKGDVHVFMEIQGEYSCKDNWISVKKGFLAQNGAC